MKYIIGLLAMLFMLELALGHAAETLLEVDFSKQMVDRHLLQKGSFDGPLPEGCNANYLGWTASVVKAKVLSENGRKFWRLTVEKVSPEIQFSWGPRSLKAPGLYRLTVRCRLASDISFAMRQFPAPYKTFWSVGISAASSGWVDRTYLIDLGQSSTVPIGLFLYPGLGVFDLAALKLESISLEEFSSSVKRPARECQNFFRNTRFPLGLQAGWNIGRDFACGAVESDPANAGPSGQPSLKIQFDKPSALYSEPFQTSDPAQRNFVSFAYKGTGKWKVAVIHTTDWLSAGGREISASDQWQTAAIPLRFDKRAATARAFTLRLTGEGVLHLDSLQAWVGAPDRTFKPQAAAEVALALPKGEASDQRIQFIDETPAIEYCAMGDLAGATLKFKAFNFYGEEKSLPPVKFGRELAPANRRGTVRYDVFPGKQLGQIRVESWIERAGQVVSPCNEILVTRLNRPVYLAKDAPDSPFGCHFNASPLTIRLMKIAGVNWARFHDASTELTGWFHLESEKGKWQFHDEEIRRYREQHISIFGGLQTAPLWASMYKTSGKKEVNGYFDRYFEPLDLAEWSNYVYTVTARYQGVISDYFIWNEPWGAGFWHSGYDAAKKEYVASPTAALDYAKLSIAAYQAAKAGNPAAKISGFNSLGGDTGKKWTQGVYDGGAYPFCDLIDYHFYTPRNQAQSGDQAQDEFAAATGFIKQKSGVPLKPVYMSEGQGNATGSSGSSGPGFYRHALTWDDDSQPLIAGDKTCRFVVANLAAGAAKVFLYSAHSYQTLALQANFNALLSPDGYPNAELAAYSQMAGKLERTQFVRKIQLNAEVDAYLFAKKAGGTVAAISGFRKAVLALPKNNAFRLADLFGNPSDGTYRGTMLYADSALAPEKLAEALQLK
ncbi:MAG: hypothetical protein WCJ07_03630 [Verrucomicrobiota bacterium]